MHQRKDEKMKKKAIEILPCFGVRLREIIEEWKFYKNIEIGDICEECGISREQCASYVNGYSLPRLPVLKHICEVLDVSADYLIGLDHDV